MAIEEVDAVSIGWDRPVEFKGTPEERRANYESHRWMNWGDPDDADGLYCDECCAKPWHSAAYWPCGAKVPREHVRYARDGSYDKCDDDAF